MLRRLQSLLGVAAAVGLSACTLLVDSGEFTGGDAGIDVDRDGGDASDWELDVAVQQDLLEEDAQRLAQWCACHASDWGYADADACVNALGPGGAYASCVEEAYRSHATEGVEFALTCQLARARQAAECKDAAECAPGTHYQCFLDRQQELFNTAGCLPSTEDYAAYFQGLVNCAASHVVGSPSGCAEDPFVGSTFLSHTVGMGNDVNFTGNPACFTNTGAADVVVPWVAAGSGPVVVDTLGTRFDTALFVASSCEEATGTTATADACNEDISFASGILQSRLELAQVTAGEPLVFVVDGFSAADFGPVRLNFTTLWCVDDMPEPTPTATEDVVDLNILTAQGDDVFQGDIDSASDSRFDPIHCGQSLDRPEVVLVWRATTGGTYEIDTAGTDFENVLYVRRSCDAEADDEYHEDACDDGSGSGTPSIQLDLMAQETLLIVVDSTDEGILGTKYQVNIHRVE